MMTQELETIAALRRQNYPYSFIARELGLSINTVKSICRRRGLKALGARKTKTEKATALLCRNCRKPLPEGSRQEVKFCCGYCRTEWHRRNRRVSEK